MQRAKSSFSLKKIHFWSLLNATNICCDGLLPKHRNKPLEDLVIWPMGLYEPKNCLQHIKLLQITHSYRKSWKTPRRRKTASTLHSSNISKVRADFILPSIFSQINLCVFEHGSATHFPLLVISAHTTPVACGWPVSQE